MIRHHLANKGKIQGLPLLFIAAGLVCIIGLILLGFGFFGYHSLFGASGTTVSSYFDSFDLSPDGETIIFSASSHKTNDLFLLNLRSNHVSQLTNTTDYKAYPAFSPDGHYIVYEEVQSLNKPRYLFIESTNGRYIRQLTRGQMVDDEWPYFSRDGKRIVFSRGTTFYPQYHGVDTWNHVDVYTIHTDGSHLERITHGNFQAVIRPKFTPDSKHILFEQAVTSGDSITDHIAIADAEGNGSTRILDQSQRDAANPYPCPDGRHIVYSGNDGSGSMGLFIVPTAGGKVTTLLPNGSGGINSVISADGRLIYFLRYGNYNLSGIWRVNADGSNLCKVVDGSLFSNPMRSNP